MDTGSFFKFWRYRRFFLPNLVKRKGEKNKARRGYRIYIEKQAAPKSNFATKYLLERSGRDLSDLHVSFGRKEKKLKMRSCNFVPPRPQRLSKCFTNFGYFKLTFSQSVTCCNFRCESCWNLTKLCWTFTDYPEKCCRMPKIWRKSIWKNWTRVTFELDLS